MELEFHTVNAKRLNFKEKEKKIVKESNEKVSMEISCPFIFCKALDAVLLQESKVSKKRNRSLSSGEKKTRELSKLKRIETEIRHSFVRQSS